MFVGCYRRPLVLAPTSSCGRSSSGSSPSLARGRRIAAAARSSNVTWVYLRRPPTPAPPLSLLLVLLPRREVKEAQRTTLPLLHPHPVAILLPLSSSPLPLAPPSSLLALLLPPRPEEGCTTTPAILLPPPSSLFALVVRSRLLEERPLSLPPPFHSPPRSPRSSSLPLVALPLLLPDRSCREDEDAIGNNLAPPPPLRVGVRLLLSQRAAGALLLPPSTSSSS